MDKLAPYICSLASNLPSNYQHEILREKSSQEPNVRTEFDKSAFMEQLTK